jgi:hypothetical protein
MRLGPSFVLGHATPKTRAHADDAAKASVEMRLICESAGQCNIRESLPRGCHHEFGALDSAHRDIRPGGGPKGLFERSREVTRTQGEQVRHFSNCQLGAEIRLDVGYSPFRLPNR